LRWRKEKSFERKKRKSGGSFDQKYFKKKKLKIKFIEIFFKLCNP